jgi:hypothetical protein
MENYFCRVLVSSDFLVVENWCGPLRLMFGRFRATFLFGWLILGMDSAPSGSLGLRAKILGAAPAGDLVGARTYGRVCRPLDGAWLRAYACDCAFVCSARWPMNLGTWK